MSSQGNPPMYDSPKVCCVHCNTTQAREKAREYTPVDEAPEGEKHIWVCRDTHWCERMRLLIHQGPR